MNTDLVIEILHGDCRELIPDLPFRSIDCIVTSPPYLLQREYGGKMKKEGEWDSIMDSLLHLPCAAKGCQLLVNLGLVHKDGECLTYWEPWRDRMKEAGWRFFGWYVWDQLYGLPGGWNGRLAPSHEFVLHFNRSARMPNKWVKTKAKPGKLLTGTGWRTKDGSRPMFAPNPYQEWKIPDSVIRLYREGGKEGNEHPARFPVDFAKHLVLSYCPEGGTVLDPFMGSGSTAIACLETGRNCIGIEVNEKYCQLAAGRIEETRKRLSLEQKSLF